MGGHDARGTLIVPHARKSESKQEREREGERERERERERGRGVEGDAWSEVER